MTTRVQKGGVVFKPAKSRARATGTPQASAPAPVRARSSLAPQESFETNVTTSSELNSQPFASTSQVDPPLPSLQPNAVPPISTSHVSNLNAPYLFHNGPSSLINSSELNHPSHHLPSAAAYPPASFAVPAPSRTHHPDPQGHAFREPVIDPALSQTPSNDAPTMGVFPATAPGALDSIGGLPNTNMPPPPPPHVLHNSEVGNMPRMALNNPGSIIKPRRGPVGQNQSAAPAEESQQGTGQEGVTDEVNESSSVSGAKSKGKGAGKTTRKSKRSRKSTETEERSDNEEASEEQPAKKRRKSSGRKTRTKSPSLPPFDADADPGEEIDPTVITMAVLCSDTGQGRVSSKAAEIQSNHAAWKAQSRAKRARMKDILERKKYGRNTEDDDANPTAAEGQTTESTDPAARKSPTPAMPADDANPDGFDYSQDLAMSRFNVQVRIGPNGETIIDDQSLVVDREEEPDTENYTHVVESDHTKFTNSGTYGKRFRGSRWSAVETELFYDALSQYGENYELIAYVLPGRDRKSCKNKFKAEDKKNHARINYCLSNMVPVDMKTLSRMTGKDFSGPVPEIRIPTPPVLDAVAAAAAATEAQVSEASTAKKVKRRKSASRDDGVQIVGDVNSFEPNFEPEP